MTRSKELYAGWRIILLLIVMMSIGTFSALRVDAIGGDPSDPEAKSFFAIWNDEDKSISFSATDP